MTGGSALRVGRGGCWVCVSTVILGLHPANLCGRLRVHRTAEVLLCELRFSSCDFVVDFLLTHMDADDGLETHVESNINALHGVFVCFSFMLYNGSVSVTHVQQYFLHFFSPAVLFPIRIVQVPRMTRAWPALPFRPLFSTLQTAFLLGSHPLEAAMLGVAGAVYYLCERAFTSRWRHTQVGLLLRALGITFLLSLVVMPQLPHSAQINSLDGHFASDR